MSNHVVLFSASIQVSQQTNIMGPKILCPSGIVIKELQGFGQAKLANGCPILSLNQFFLLPQLPQKRGLRPKLSKLTQK